MMFLQSITMSSGRGVIPHRRSRELSSPQVREQKFLLLNRLNSGTDGIVRMKEGKVRVDLPFSS